MTRIRWSGWRAWCPGTVAWSRLPRSPDWRQAAGREPRRLGFNGLCMPIQTASTYLSGTTWKGIPWSTTSPRRTITSVATCSPTSAVGRWQQRWLRRAAERSVYLESHPSNGGIPIATTCYWWANDTSPTRQICVHHQECVVARHRGEQPAPRTEAFSTNRGLTTAIATSSSISRRSPLR